MKHEIIIGSPWRVAHPFHAYLQMTTALKTLKRYLSLVIALVVLSAWILPELAIAQTFTVLHHFVSDGAYPDSALILSNNVIYGVTGSGGSGNGIVFRMNSDGSGFTNLYSFSTFTNGGGVSPRGALVLSGNTLYGATTSGGGPSNGGTIFRINTDGTGFTNLHSFVFADGLNPAGSLVLLGNTLYGATAFGGVTFANLGTVFAINTDGTGYTNLHVFTSLGNDGGRSYSGLVTSGGTLYGTTIGGGGAGYGVVFALNTNGTGYTTLHSFPGPSGTSQTEGIYPYSTLVISGNMLYGTTYQGGNAAMGLVFSLTTDGLTYTKLHDFTDASVSPFTNLDGALPYAGLALSGDTLYGTTIHGGTSGYGVLYAIKTNGTAFTNLHSLAIGDGVNPKGSLVFGNNNLYGTTTIGDSSNANGSLFRLALSSITVPKLTIALSGTNVVLTWATNAPGFTLESTTNIAAPVPWATNSSPITILNGQYTVTNFTAGTQEFYRLIQ